MAQYLLVPVLWLCPIFSEWVATVFTVTTNSQYRFLYFHFDGRLHTNEYSVNLPTRFFYRKKWNKGWINVVNPFRASIVLGTPGSGKSYAIVNNYIKEQIRKGFSMYIYDFKFDDLSVIAYNTLMKNLDKYRVEPKFYVINFDNPKKSHRCNPINPAFMTDLSDAYESAYTIMLNLNKTWIQKQGDFFVESPIILLAAIIGFQDFSQLKRDYGDKEAAVVANTVGNIFSGQVVGESAKNLSEHFGKVLQKRQSMTINRQDKSTSISTQLDSLIPASKISNLTQGMFFGAVSDNFDERIEQKIFHAEIVVDNAAVARETKNYEQIPEILDFRDKDGNDTMQTEIERNYNQIKADVKQIVANELKRIADDPALQHLIKKE